MIKIKIVGQNYIPISEQIKTFLALPSKYTDILTITF